MNNVSTAEIMDRGINCLLEKLGSVETERFISVLIREEFDYTKWRRQYFDDVDAEAFNAAATEYAKAHPFKAKNEQLSAPAKKLTHYQTQNGK